MSLKIRFIIPLFIFLVIILFFWHGLKLDPMLLPSMLVDKSAPQFFAESLENSNIKISNEIFKNKITLLNVWATWCVACQIEHPLLVDLSNKSNIQVLGLDYKDERKSALNYLKERQTPYRHIIYDPEGKIAMQFGVYGTPESFLIDRKGIVRYRYVGPISLEILENNLLPRIKQLESEN